MLLDATTVTTTTNLLTDSTELVGIVWGVVLVGSELFREDEEKPVNFLRIIFGILSIILGIALPIALIHAASCIGAIFIN
jgi:hypothetical protein